MIHPGNSRQRKRHQYRSLPVQEWPQADRRVSEEACRPGIRLKPGGRASHFAEASLKDFINRYGAYLGFLQRRGILNLKAPAAAQVSRSNVKAYAIGQLFGYDEQGFTYANRNAEASQMITAGMAVYRATRATVYLPFFLQHLSLAYAPVGQLDEASRSVRRGRSRKFGNGLAALWIAYLKCMSLQSLQLSFCCG